MKSQPKVIIITETTGQSWTRDIGTFALVLALWAIGHLAESPALEWLGIAAAILITTGKAVSVVKRDGRIFTPQQAREWLDKTYPS